MTFQSFMALTALLNYFINLANVVLRSLRKGAEVFICKEVENSLFVVQC